MVAAVGTVANKCEELGQKAPEWKIWGVNSKQAQTFLVEKMKRNKILPKLYSASSAPTLLRSIQQSHLCLPPSCYTDYSFEGLEAMAAGLPTTVQDDSHIAAMIKRHYSEHEDHCIVTGTSDNLAVKITKTLFHNIEAFQNAKKLKEDLTKSKAVTQSLTKFASIFKWGEAGTRDSNKSDKNRREDASVLSVMPFTGDKRYEENMVAMQADISIAEDTGITETTAMNSGMSVIDDVEINETTAVQPEIPITAKRERRETTTMHPGMPVTADMETTAVHQEMSVTEDMEITDTTAVHHGMSLTEDKETTETTAVHHGIVRHEASKTSRNFKHTEAFENKETVIQTKHRSQRKRKSMHGNDKSRNPKTARGKEIRSRQCKQSEHGQTERNENSHTKTKQTTQQMQTMRRINTNPSKSPHLDSTTASESTYVFIVNVGLNEEPYQQQMSDIDGQVQTRKVRKKNEQLKAAWEKIQAELDKNESEAITNMTSLQRVDQNCRDSFGEGTVTMSTKRDSLAISLDLPTLYNLYRLKQTCLSGSFPDSFEPLLITDKMREEADKVGLQLNLKATYDQARFDELELFFMNRDGGGLVPVKLHDDLIEGKDAEEIHVDDEDTDQKCHTMVTGRVAGSSQDEQGRSWEDIQSNFDMERATLECELKEAKEEKATMEERCKELTQKLDSSEQSLVSQRIGNSVEREKLQSELELKETLIKELQDKVAELDHNKGQSDMQRPGEKGDWSLTLVNGQHQDQGQNFNGPRGLVFHHDKLVVCDSDNNIVQILNKDYTCNNVLGSFDGQFAKPFRPKSVAISGFNHYFILDDANKQIVVCDENSKIIQIITLPENVKVVWDIALMDDFVLVTLSLFVTLIFTNPYNFTPEDRDDRLVKYTQGGQYVARIDGQGSDKTKFYSPVSLAVNSNNVIMVYDSGNYCIKCFDRNLNFLYQYGQSQLSKRIMGYLDVDEDDNVYVCGVMDRVIKYRCDGKWICDLFKGDVREPWYIAAMGDKIGIVEGGSDQIKVFSK
ncbi:titin homolog [Ptychodera flava]|uniref:titin homolog n=1 Tax=Ptychodera flava TaxID=63121 RepID=UPI003969F29B